MGGTAVFGFVTLSSQASRDHEQEMSVWQVLLEEQIKADEGRTTSNAHFWSQAAAGATGQFMRCCPNGYPNAEWFADKNRTLEAGAQGQ